MILEFKSPGHAVTANSRDHWARKRKLLQPWLLSNLMPTQKAIIDELVRLGLWPDDTPEYVTELMPTIEISGLVTITIQPR